MRNLLPPLAAYLAAALVTGALASLIQTQLVLAVLLAYDAPVTGTIRAWTTLADLARFGPVMMGIAAVALLPAFWLASRLTRARGATARCILAIVAGASALAVAFWLMREVIPMPAIPGTRTAAGHAWMSLAGAFGGWVFARLRVPAAPAAAAWTATVLVAAPIGLFFAMAPRANDPPPTLAQEHYRVQTVSAGLNRPWSIAFLPDGRALVTEMGGGLRAIALDGTRTDIATDALPARFEHAGVAGMMDVALDPRFEQTGWLYLSMSYGTAAANGTRLVRARLNATGAQPRLEDVRILFDGTLKPRPGNNGGRIAFLPDDTLVLSIGDGLAQREAAQRLDDHLGTVIRLDRDGRAPDDNPFARQSGAAAQIYSLGHRNMQGLTIDPFTGDLLASEHGARGGDEINRVLRGRNYGWPVVANGIDYPFASVTPFTRLAGYEDALLQWTPAIAPAGLAVYDGALFADWRGDLLVPALKTRDLRRVKRDGRQIVGEQRLLVERDERVRDVAVGPDGAIYVLTDGPDGALLRLTPSSPTP